MNLFEFNGDWELEYQFEAFQGFQSRQGAYAGLNSDEPSSGLVKVYIKDELNDDTEPSASQINALNFIIENPELIKTKLCEALEQYYPTLIDIFGEDDEYLPKFSNNQELMRYFGIGNIFVHIVDKADFAYIGLECGCIWDEEHGLGFLLHKDEVIEIGNAEISFDTWNCYKDNGTYEKKMKENEENMQNKKVLPKPKKYETSDNYKKLKPSHIDANASFEFALIERGYNKDFIDMVEEREIDIEKPSSYLNMYHIERAAQFNNIEVVSYILSKNPKKIGKSIHQTINLEILQLLVHNGADINEPNSWGRRKLGQMKEWLNNLTNEPIQDINKIREVETLINWLIEQGAK